MPKRFKIDEIFQDLAPQPEPRKRGRPRKVVDIADRQSPIKEPAPAPMGRLMKIRNASAHLNELLDGGFSQSEIRKRIRNGTWQRGREYRKTGRIYKIDIDAVIRWQAAQ